MRNRHCRLLSRVLLRILLSEDLLVIVIVILRASCVLDVPTVANTIDTYHS